MNRLARKHPASPCAKQHEQRLQRGQSHSYASKPQIYNCVPVHSMHRMRAAGIIDPALLSVPG